MTDRPEQNLQTEHKKIVIFVNNRKFETEKKEMTGYEIKILAGVPADYELFQVVPGTPESVPVGPEEVVHLKEGQHFRAIPAGTFGRHAITSQT